MNPGYEALREVHDKLLQEWSAIMDEHWVLQSREFDADEYRLHELRIRRHREALVAYRQWAARLRGPKTLR